MSVAIVIGILIAAGDLQGPDSAALVAALSDVLGPGPSIVVQHTPSLTDAQVGLKGKELHATALVAVEHRSAATDVSLRILMVADDRWIVRRINFLARDTAVERGRAIGLTAGAILLDEAAIFSSASAPAERDAVSPVAAAEESGSRRTETRNGIRIPAARRATHLT
jgi:hypothetical protein